MPDERGAPAAAGPVLALLATGSLIAGLAYGALHLAAPLHRQFLVTVSAFGVLVCTLPLASSIPVLSGLALGTGLAVAPTLIAGFALVERLVPAASLTEGLAWISTGIGFGLAIGSSAGGWAVEAAGAQAAYVVTAGSGLAAAALTWAGRRQLRAGRQRSPGERLGLGDELPVSRGGDSASRSAGRTAP